MTIKNLAGIGMTSQRTRSRLVNRLKEKGITDGHVLEAINSTPRHLFIDEAMAHRAYEDKALPIGMWQTISQPYIVAKMTEVLMAGGRLNNVLEVGTGCGYQTSILSLVAHHVFTIERIQVLQEAAVRRFNMLRLRNIKYKYDDGFLGWQEKAPFDAIIVTAASNNIPEILIEQLDVGGRMVIPLIQKDNIQQLMLLEKTSNGLKKKKIETVRFVPLLSGVV